MGVGACEGAQGLVDGGEGCLPFLEKGVEIGY